MNTTIQYKKTKKGGSWLFSELSVNMHNTQYTKGRAFELFFFMKK